MTKDGQVILQRRGSIGEIILDRPHKHNALTPQMYRQIGSCCAEADANQDINVILFRGAGDKAFCSGSDIKAMEQYADFWEWRNRHDYIPPILNLRKPAIAAVKGWALGGGLEIALACDVRVASRSAVFAAPEVALGWNGAGGAAQHLVRLCGYGIAMRLLLTGERFSAEEAYRHGMVEFLVDEGEELAAARELASSIAEHSSVATQAVKASVRAALDMTVARGLQYENELMSLCLAKLGKNEQAKRSKGSQ